MHLVKNDFLSWGRRVESDEWKRRGRGNINCIHLSHLNVGRKSKKSTVCPQSPFGVLKNCAAKTN
jgi:hypothetical protein